MFLHKLEKKKKCSVSCAVGSCWALRKRESDTVVLVTAAPTIIPWAVVEKSSLKVKRDNIFVKTYIYEVNLIAQCNGRKNRKDNICV